MSRFDRILTLVENVVAGGALALATLIAITQVLLRTIFDIHLYWSEETIVYLIIYSTFIGAVVTLRHNEHISINVFEPFVGKVGKRRLEILGVSVMIVYLVIVGFFAWMLLFEPFSSATVTPTLKLPLWVVELAVPLGLTLMLLRSIEMLVRLARGKPGFAEGDKSEFQRAEESIGIDDAKPLDLGNGEAKS